MALSDELSKFIPKDFGKKSKKSSKGSGGVSGGYGKSTKDKSQKNKRHSKSNPMSADTRNDNADAVIDSNTDRVSGDVDSDQQLPVDHHIVLSSGKKVVSTLTWDVAGETLCSGTHSGQMNLWDFKTMDGSFQPTRTVHPYEEGQRQQIRIARFNHDGSSILICSSADPRAKLLDSSGRVVREFKRGDMYLLDMRRTVGHVAPLTSVDWSPRNPERFISSAADSTVRVWNSENAAGQEQVLVAKSNVGKRRPVISSCAYSVDGSTIGMSQVDDGSLSLWAANASAKRPTHYLKGAHASGSDISFVFMPDSQGILSRGSEDSMVKLWDIRRFDKPLAEVSGMHAAATESNLALSPDSRRVLVGLGRSPQDGGGGDAGVAVLDTSDLRVRRRLDMPFSSDVVSVCWHPHIDQIAASSSDGSIGVFYNKEGVRGGAILCAGRRVARRQVSEITGPIITPHALPLFKDEPSTLSTGAKRRRAAERTKPGVPVYGHGSGGNIGVNETQHIMKTLMKDTLRDEDPREALLRYAQVAESDPMFIAPAYGDNNKSIFEEDDDNASEEHPLKKRK
ncbi:hypothetical protein GGI15_002833 [Coemansia interrupta]|uniref:Uncharacterized protein n=1 Tax=Coemansia interrupta TaxID=1126814 RepID=A0A9W8HDS9_9FUNG|nr:hypothetical protein GGI15_002833 [Coemansia interrupta]